MFLLYQSQVSLDNMKYYKATQVHLLLAASLVAIIAGPVYQNTFCKLITCSYICHYGLSQASTEPACV